MSDGTDDPPPLAMQMLTFESLFMQVENGAGMLGILFTSTGYVFDVALAKAFGCTCLMVVVIALFFHTVAWMNGDDLHRIGINTNAIGTCEVVSTIIYLSSGLGAATLCFLLMFVPPVLTSLFDVLLSTFLSIFGTGTILFIGYWGQRTQTW